MIRRASPREGGIAVVVEVDRRARRHPPDMGGEFPLEPLARA